MKWKDSKQQQKVSRLPSPGEHLYILAFLEIDFFGQVRIWLLGFHVSYVCFSLNMRGEDNNGRPERPTSLRLPLGELSPYEASTPQGDNTQSPIGLQNTLSVNGVRQNKY